MEIFHNSPTRKMEKKEQMSFDDDNKRDGARSENRLMKQIKIKNELLKKAEKKEKGKKKLQRARQIEDGRVLRVKTLQSNLKI